MRTLLGAPQEWVLLGVLGLVTLVLGVLGTACLRNPLLLKLALRNLPRRPGFAVLVTLGLTLGTVILSSSLTTGDTMSLAVRSVVAGVLGSADEVVFVPRPQARATFEIAQAIASGNLLTALAAPFPASDVARVEEVLRGNPRVAGVMAVLLEQQPLAVPGREFRAQVNLMGVPGQVPAAFGGLRGLDGRELGVDALPADGIYLNTEAATALGATAGDTVRLYGPAGEHDLQVAAITRLGDLGGGQATVFLPLARLQSLLGLEGQVNQVLIANRGDSAERLRHAWPVTVALRAAFLDDFVALQAYRGLRGPAARQAIATALAHAPGPQAEKLRLLEREFSRGELTDEFEALVQDPELLARLAQFIPGARSNGRSGPFSATLAGSPFRVLDVQRIAEAQAATWGSAFTDLFVVVGLFSLFSGLLLIVLVFSLLALERRSELGIMRALGGRRQDVILLLALEGGLYALISSLFGLGGGVAIGWLLVSYAAGLVRDYGFRLEPRVEPASLAVAYGVGVVITFFTVTFTAWRSSRFSIVTAIRETGDPEGGPPGVRSLVLCAVPLAGGIGLVLLGVSRSWSLAYAAGVAAGVAGAALVLRWLLRWLGVRRGERLVFTLAGLVLVLWWSVPPEWFRRVGLPVVPRVVEMSFLAGVAMLLGAVWLLAYNVGVLRRLRGGASAWRLSTAYVATYRFRTGMTLAMFGLVVLTLTLGAVLLGVAGRAFGDPDAAAGGWDVRGESPGPPRDIAAELANGPVPAGAITGVGASSALRVEAVQTGATDGRWRSISLQVVDEGFTASTQARLVSGARDERAVWRQLIERPGTALVGAALLRETPGVPAIDAVEGDGFQPFVLWVRDTRSTQQAIRLEVIGLVDARGPYGNQVLVGRDTVAAWPSPERTIYAFTAAAGVNLRELSAAITLAVPDVAAQPTSEELRLASGIRGLLYLILQGFMGIGLLSGVAALGTLSTRAVVERRRQIGVLRALGFRARAIGVGLMAESLIVALLGSALGVGVGLYVARGTVDFLARQNPELRFVLPVEQVLGVVALAVGASLLMTLLPARHAAAISPAAALRDG